MKDVEFTISGELGAAHILLLNMHFTGQLLPRMVINECEIHKSVLWNAFLLRITIGTRHFDLLLFEIDIRSRSPCIAFFIRIISLDRKSHV